MDKGLLNTFILFNKQISVTVGDLLHVVGFSTAFGYFIYLMAKPYTEQPANELFDFQENGNQAVDADDIGCCTKFCRCLRSKKFPYCDNSHLQYNADNCDNIKPLILYNQNTTSLIPQDHQKQCHGDTPSTDFMKPMNCHQVPQQAQGQQGYDGDSDSTNVADVTDVAEVSDITDCYDDEGTCGDDELDE